MAEKKNEVGKQQFTTALSQWSTEITGLIARDYEACGVTFDDYSKRCALEAMTAIFNLVKNNPKIKDMNSLDTSNLRGIVEHCASLKLNASAYPRECYFQLRNTKVGVDADGKDIWQYVVEMGYEGAGYDSLLTNWGKDVERVYPYWVVKEGDEYIPPKHKGIEVTPPEWEEKGLSERAVRVVYPVKLTDGTITYLTAEREGVKVNLLAHVRQNMMNETFGVLKGTKKSYGKDVPRTRYDATEEEKKAIDAEKEKVLDALRACETLDNMLKCEIAKPFISAAWLDTPESMIVRKMCNNATRKYPKNYNPMARQAQIEMDEIYQQVQEEIETCANTEEFTPAAIEEHPEPPTIPHEQKEKEPVPAGKGSRPTPEFMQ